VKELIISTLVKMTFSPIFVVDWEVVALMCVWTLWRSISLEVGDINHIIDSK
jgi:hypothetical protein